MVWKNESLHRDEFLGESFSFLSRGRFIFLEIGERRRNYGNRSGE